METRTENTQLKFPSLKKPGELFARAWSYFSADWQRLFRISATYIFGVLAIRLLIASGVNFFYKSGAKMEFLLWLVPIVVLLVVAGILFDLWGSLALLLALKKRKFSWEEAYRNALPLIFRYAALQALIGFIVALGFLLLIVPGIYAGVLIGFAPYVFVLEEEGVLKSLRKSRDYVRGYWLQVFWREVVLSLLIFFISFLALLLFQVLFLPQLLKEILFAALQAAVVPTAAIYVLLIYKDLKDRYDKLTNSVPDIKTTAV
jgi:hypothetical protein